MAKCRKLSLVLVAVCVAAQCSGNGGGSPAPDADGGADAAFPVDVPAADTANDCGQSGGCGLADFGIDGGWDAGDGDAQPEPVEHDAQFPDVRDGGGTDAAPDADASLFDAGVPCDAGTPPDVDPNAGPCLDPGDLQGSYLDRDWTQTAVFVENVREVKMSATTLVWIVPRDQFGGSDIRYLDLDTHVVRRIPKCRGETSIMWLATSGDFIYWNDDVPGAWQRSAILQFNTSTSVATKVVSKKREVAYPSPFRDLVVYPAGNDCETRARTIFNDSSQDQEVNVVALDRYVDETYLYWHYAFLWERTFIFHSIHNWPKNSPDYNECVSSYDLDSGTLTDHVCSKSIYGTSQYGYKYAYQDWRTGNSDVYIYDLKAKTETNINNDAGHQWCPNIWENLVVYQDLTESGSPEGGPGFLWVYDLETTQRRKIPFGPMVGCPNGINSRHVAFRAGFSATQGALHLIDMEKAGVVKDGHVVPEAGDGGTSGQ
jgi:hypothetical protein